MPVTTTTMTVMMMDKDEDDAEDEIMMMIDESDDGDDDDIMITMIIVSPVSWQLSCFSKATTMWNWLLWKLIFMEIYGKACAARTPCSCKYSRSWRQAGWLAAIVL